MFFDLFVEFDVIADRRARSTRELASGGRFGDILHETFHGLRGQHLPSL